MAAGCGSDDPQQTDRAGVQATYLTSFANFGRDAYAWVALEKGYFRDAGFDVTIQKGQGTGGNIQAVLSGQVQYAPVDLTGGLLYMGKNQTTDFTAVAAIQQRTMAAIASTEDKNIKTPKDLAGKTLADTPGSVVRNLFPTYAALAGIDEKTVTWVDGDAATLIATLGTGKVDGIGQFVVGRPTIAAVTKKNPVFLPYSDLLPDLFGNVLITRTALAKEKPDEVKRFTAALLKGLDYALANPQEAGEILKKNEPTANPAAARAELELMAPFVRPDGTGSSAATPGATATGGGTLGAIDTTRVARAITILEDAGQIPAGLTPESIVSVELTPKA
ncbi:ABC transporter substrate-binding protein [Actinomycetes bacterium KLBMP 9797]